jgi:hypothetical protein
VKLLSFNKLLFALGKMPIKELAILFDSRIISHVTYNHVSVFYCLLQQSQSHAALQHSYVVIEGLLSKLRSTKSACPLGAGKICGAEPKFSVISRKKYASY